MQKNKTETKNLTYGEFCWTEKYLEIEEYVNIYNRKLFVTNYFSKYSEGSEVHLKIDFVISEMKVYLVKFFLVNNHEVTSLPGQASTSLNYYACVIFFYENVWPCLTSSS